MRLRRSELAVPASNPRMVEKSAGSDADLVFLDLEDAVAPDKKEGARQIAIDGLNQLDWGNKVRSVRVNDHTTRWAVDDMISMVEGAGDNIDIIILPKVKQPRDIWFFETMLDGLEQKLGLTRKIGLEALNVEAIATSSPRLEALILGFGDLSGSMSRKPKASPTSKRSPPPRRDSKRSSSASATSPAAWACASATNSTRTSAEDFRYPGDMWSAHRVRMIAACRAAGIDAIDGPFGDFRNDKSYLKQATYAATPASPKKRSNAATLGAVGKWCIHPNQIPLANDVFAPSPKEIEQAQKMVDLYNESVPATMELVVAKGAGAGGKGGQLVDAATLRIYQPVLDRARATGRL